MQPHAFIGAMQTQIAVAFVRPRCSVREGRPQVQLGQGCLRHTLTGNQTLKAIYGVKKQNRLVSTSTRNIEAFLFFSLSQAEKKWLKYEVKFGYRRIEPDTTPERKRRGQGEKKQKARRGSPQNGDGAREEQRVLVSECLFGIPCNLFVFSFSRLDFETSVVHVVYISRGLQVTEDVILEFRNGLEEIRDVLVLLDISDNLCGLGSLIEVNQFGWCK